MDKVIHKLRAIPYSGQDILNALHGETKIILYKDLKKYKSIDEVFNPYDSVVLLYETKLNYGHWVCLVRYRDQHKISYFDPYGKKIDTPLKYMDKEYAKQVGNYPYLSDLLNKSDYTVTYNKKPLQKMNKDISSCGRHVALRLILKDYDLDDYLNLFKGAGMNPDDVVTYLTAFN